MLNPFVSWLICFAAALYIGERLGMVVRALIVRTSSIRIKKLEEFMNEENKKLGVHFDLWWSGRPLELVKHSIIKKFPPDFMEFMPKEVSEGLIDTASDAAKKAAMFIAFHTRVIDRVRTDVNGFSKKRLLHHMSHITDDLEDSYKNAVLTVVEFDLDPTKIEEAFAD